MGELIGHIGGFAMMAAVFVLFVAFLAESGLVKDRERLSINVKAVFFTAAAGFVIYFITVWLKNVMSGQINAFDFGKIFTFAGIDTAVGAYTGQQTAVGVFVPFFPKLINIFGNIVFEQYGAIALLLNFTAVCGGMCCIHRILCDIFGKKLMLEPLLFLLALPYSFVLFTPGVWGAGVGLAMIAAYAWYKKNYILYGIIAVLAVLVSKAGLAVIIAPLLGFMNIKPFVTSAAKSCIVQNPYIRAALFYILIIINAALLFSMMAGGR